MLLLPEELYDVFYVTQLTRGTALERVVAVDRVRVQAGRNSQIHRHLEAETVLFIEKGFGVVIINGERHEVAPGSRICIAAGAWHGVATFNSELIFISVQSPPIHDEATGRHDLEPLKS